jgi:hypothetical protein
VKVQWKSRTTGIYPQTKQILQIRQWMRLPGHLAICNTAQRELAVDLALAIQQRNLLQLRMRLEVPYLHISNKHHMIQEMLVLTAMITL